MSASASRAPRPSRTASSPTSLPLFTAPAWLRSGHAQTLWPALTRRPPRVQQRKERLELPDGDALNLVWGPDSEDGLLVLILHGLAGCARSPYVLGLMNALAHAGMGSVVMEFRGAGATPNRTPRFFHAGETGDVDQTVRLIRRRHPERPLALVGFSMGGIVGLNWLGRAGSDAAVQLALIVSAPLRLAECSRRLGRGFSQVYQWNILRGLKAMLRRKQAAGAAAPVRTEAGLRANSLWDFDDQLTAPLHGFSGAVEYYRCCAPEQRLQAIRVPTLMIHAADDPFCPAETLPPPGACSPWVTLALSPGGGHMGFVAGQPWRPIYWLESALIGQLKEARVRP